MKRRIKQALWDASPNLFKLVTRPHDGQTFSIGIYTGPTATRLSPAAGVKNPVLSKAQITDVPAAFVADPFMVRFGETWHLFFEVMNKATGRGQIGLATSADGRQWDYTSIVLAEPFHLAYPYVFRHKSSFYLVPDSPDQGVRIYRAVDFPRRWQFVDTLLDGGRFSDSSIFEFNGNWWMLTAWSKATSQTKALRLFQADTPLGPWTEHPASPVVKANVRKTRPAGRVVVVDGVPVRFAQDAFPAYGSRVRAFEILDLDAGHYREREVRNGRPILKGCGFGWNADGMHHVDAHELNDGSWIACVDGWHA